MMRATLPRVVDAPGLPLHLRLLDDAGLDHMVEVSPATALLLAEDLLRAARRRLAEGW